MVDTCEIPFHCTASFRFHFVLHLGHFPPSFFVQYRVPPSRIHPTERSRSRILCCSYCAIKFRSHFPQSRSYRDVRYLRGMRALISFFFFSKRSFVSTSNARDITCLDPRKRSMGLISSRMCTRMYSNIDRHWTREDEETNES